MRGGMALLHSLAALTAASVLAAVSLLGTDHHPSQQDAGAFGGRIAGVERIYREPASHASTTLRRVHCAGTAPESLCFETAARR